MKTIIKYKTIPITSIDIYSEEVVVIEKLVEYHLTFLFVFIYAQDIHYFHYKFDNKPLIKQRLNQDSDFRSEVLSSDEYFFEKIIDGHDFLNEINSSNRSAMQTIRNIPDSRLYSNIRNLKGLDIYNDYQLDLPELVHILNNLTCLDLQSDKIRFSNSESFDVDFHFLISPLHFSTEKP